jgi:phage terminase large subunit
MRELEATEIFEVTWEAMNAYLKDESGEYILDEKGERMRKYKYIVHEGSSRSSKTYSLIQSLYLYCIKNHVRASVWRDTAKDCKDTIGFDMSQIYPEMPYSQLCKYRESKGRYDFVNTKSVIEIRGTDEEKKVMGYNGGIAWLNEPYEISKSTFDQIDQRTEELIIIDWNPKKAHWIDQVKKDKRCLTIHSTYKNNPFCPREQKIKIEGYQPVKMSKAVEGACLTESEALVYDYVLNEKGLNAEDLAELTRCQENERKESADAYNWSVYGLGLKAEKPNRILRWKKIPLQQFYDLDVQSFFGVDWGKSDPFGIIECKYYDGDFYIRERNYASENDIRLKLTPTERQQIDSEEEGLVTWLFRKLGINESEFLICDPNRKLKIIALRQIGYDNAISAHKPPGSIKDGIDLLQNLNVYYTDDSPNVEYEQENYSYKKDRYGIVTEDPIDKDNHTIDPARYVATFLAMEGVIKMA